MLHDVVRAACDFLSYEGCRGASLTRLWEHLSRHLLPASEPPAQLADAIKAAVWQHILTDERTFGLCCAEAHVGTTATVKASVDGAHALDYSRCYTLARSQYARTRRRAAAHV